MIYFLEYLIIRVFIALVEILPWSIAYGVGSGLGDILYFLIKPRKKLVLDNLELAWPGKFTVREKEVIVHKIYRNFGRTLVEFAKIIHWKKDIVGDKVKIEGLDNIDKAKAKGKGVVLFTGHIGNWHVMGRVLSLSGYSVSNVIKRQKNPWVAGWILDQVKRAGMKSILQNANSPREIIRALRNNEIVEFLGDLHAGNEGIFVNFLGRPASVYMGPVVLAMRTGSPIVVAVDVRLDDNTHQVFIEEPIYLPTGKAEENEVEKYLSLVTGRLEKYIIRYPDQWFWLHNRWKTQPVKGPGASSQGPGKDEKKI
jgi:Kdo2-lipid IVA lauroyltransferase/acyltransferase